MPSLNNKINQQWNAWVNKSTNEWESEYVRACVCKKTVQPPTLPKFTTTTATLNKFCTHIDSFFVSSFNWKPESMKNLAFVSIAIFVLFNCLDIFKMAEAIVCCENRRSWNGTQTISRISCPRQAGCFTAGTEIGCMFECPTNSQSGLQCCGADQCNCPTRAAGTTMEPSTALLFPTVISLVAQFVSKLC